MAISTKIATPKIGGFDRMTQASEELSAFPLESEGPMRQRPAGHPAILLIDGDPRMLHYLQRLLQDHFRSLAAFGSGEAALECIRKGMRSDIVVASGSLPDMSGRELLVRIRRLRPYAKVALTAHLYEYAELLSVRHPGIREILLKPFGAAEVLDVLARLMGEGDPGVEPCGGQISLGNNEFLVCAGSAMREIQEQAVLIARVNVPVLILGESGTGKEVLARYIHSLSPQATLPFLKVNCAAVPSELLESELFGYERGAFTGAGHSKPGKFQQCKNGTMFLDEIGEMPPRLQAKLLQVLQDGSFSPLGSRGTEKVSVRVLAATNMDIEAAISQKLFREDLYYRLNGICLRLPPLRERRDEIPQLIEHFIRKCSKQLALDAPPSLSARLRKACLHYDWPGNLRELENFVKRYLVLGDEQLRIDELIPDIALPEDHPVAVTRESIEVALSTSGGNRRVAAKALGISYKVLLGRLRKLKLDPAPVSVHMY